MSGTVDLIYNIATMKLIGNLDDFSIDAIGYSGGRGGSKTLNAENFFIVNNPFLTRLKYDDKKKGSIGGPLPMGIYKLKLHEKKPNRIRLDATFTLIGRTNDFEIHGRGPIGSQGCIVLKDISLITKIHDAVKKRAVEKQANFLLKVIAVGDLSYWEGLA